MDNVFEAMPHGAIIDRPNLVNEIEDGQSEVGIKDIQRTRHRIFRYDLSTVANHSHLVFMVSCLCEQMNGKMGKHPGKSGIA